MLQCKQISDQIHHNDISLLASRHKNSHEAPSTELWDIPFLCPKVYPQSTYMKGSVPRDKPLFCLKDQPTF